MQRGVAVCIGAEKRPKSSNSFHGGKRDAPELKALGGKEIRTFVTGRRDILLARKNNRRGKEEGGGQKSNAMNI